MALLEVQDVTVRFGGVVAVDGAGFHAEAGRVSGLIGPNGAGKTTLFNVISGLEPPTSGTVTIDGRDVTKLAVHERARLGVARTFQRLEVFGSLTVWENVLVAAEIAGRWGDRGAAPEAVAREVIARVGLEDFASQQADSVPTGIARLTELARALTLRPRLLLLDEPSSGLDEEETGAFAALLTELAAEGRAVLVVEHDMDLVMSVCERISVLHFGRIIAEGGPDEIRNDRAVQEAYLGTSSDVTYQ